MYGIYLFGLYATALLIWFAGLWIANIFGYQTPRDRNEAVQERMFLGGRKITFCRLVKTSPLYCDQVWLNSTAMDDAVRDWVQIKRAKDKEAREKAPYWGIFLVFTDPFNEGK